MINKSLKERLQKLAGINAKLLKEQNVEGGYNGNDPFLYGGGPQPGGIPWHPTQYNGDNYPVPAGYNEDPFGNTTLNSNNCTYGNNCCGALYFCEFCDPNDVSTVLDFMIQNNISEINKVYMVNDETGWYWPTFYDQSLSNQCIDPSTGWNYIRFTGFTLTGWMWNGVILPGDGDSWAIGTDQEEDLLNNTIQNDDNLSTYFGSLFGESTGVDSGLNASFGNDPTDNQYVGLFNVLEWLGIDYSSISSFQDLVDLFNNGGNSVVGDIGGSLCYAGSHGTSCKPDNCYCATPCLNEDGTPCEYEGCTDPIAINYSEFATIDDGSCQYGSSGYVCCNTLVNYPAAHEAAGSPCNSVNQNSLGTNFWQNFSSTGCVYSENWLLPQSITTDITAFSSEALGDSGYNYNVDFEQGTYTTQQIFPSEQECASTCAPWEWYCINQFVQTEFYQNYQTTQLEVSPYMADIFSEEELIEQGNASFFNNGDGFDVNANGCVQAPNMEVIPTVDPLSYFSQTTATYASPSPNYQTWQYGLTALSISGQPAYKDEQGCNNACQTPGCTDPEAFNYNEFAAVDDGSCKYSGCTDPNAFNYDEEATLDNGSCEYEGCVDPNAANYDPEAVGEDTSSCEYPGCTNDTALNYDPQANIDDGSCEIEGCTDAGADNYNEFATIDDGTCTFTFGCQDLIDLPIGPILDGTAPYGIMENGTTFCEACGSDCASELCAEWYTEIYGPPGENWYTFGIVDTCSFWEQSSIMENFTPWILGVGVFDANGLVSSPVPPEYLTGEYLANCCEGGPNWEQQGCTDILAINYNPDADVDNGSCEYTSYACTPQDSLLGGECIEVPVPPYTTFEFEFGVNLPTFATIEECQSFCKEEKGKIKCWKCKDGAPVMQQFLNGNVIDEQQTYKDDLKPLKGKGGCPEGWELAPDPWPYNVDNNPCKKYPDKERDPERDPELEDPLDTTSPAGEEDDTIMTGGPFFCPADSGNFPWPSCCVQAGVDYSSVLTQYPEAPNWLQTYFDSPVGQTYSSNVECNANSGCGQNMLPNGTGNCAGTYIPGPPDDESVITESLRKRLQKLAGIKKSKK